MIQDIFSFNETLAPSNNVIESFKADISSDRSLKCHKSEMSRWFHSGLEWICNTAGHCGWQVVQKVQRGSSWKYDGYVPVSTESIRGKQAGHYNKAHFLLYDKWMRPHVREQVYNEMMEICRTLTVPWWWRRVPRLRLHLWLCFCLRCQGSITAPNVIITLITMMIMIMMQ